MSTDSKEENEKKIEKESFIFILVFEIIFFTLSYVFSIFSFFRIQKFFIVQHQSISAIPQYSIKEFLLNFFIAIAFILILVYFLKNLKIKSTIFRAIFLLAVLIGSFFLFSIWFPFYLVVLFTFLIFLLLTKTSVPIFHNLALILAISGSAVGIALRVSPFSVAALISIFSIYDFLAVYKTKHMIKMAEEMMKGKAVLGLLLPNKDANFFSEIDSNLPTRKFVVLGAGDLVLPLIFCLSFLKEGILQTFIMFLFSVLGFLFSGFIFYKNQKAIPALPPIAFFCLIGYLINSIFF